MNDEPTGPSDTEPGLLGSGEDGLSPMADEFFGTASAGANDPWSPGTSRTADPGAERSAALGEPTGAGKSAIGGLERDGLDGDGFDSADDHVVAAGSRDFDADADGAEGEDEGEHEDEEELRSPLRSLIEWGVVIVGAFVLAFVINAYLVQAFYIPSESMVPALVKNDRVLVNKISNRFSDPSRGQLVVFRHPDPATNAGGERDLIKRIIGEPGDTVELVNGRVFVNGAQLEESYLPEGVQTVPSGSGLAVWTLGSDEYLVLGDNRTSSQDSRFFGPVPRDNIIGRAFVKFWPLSDIEWL